MQIVQISDLHVGSQFLQEKFDTLVDEVNEINPDVIVITGDLTNEGLMSEYKKCLSLLKQFNTKKIIRISGNHDYRNTGYLLFKKRETCEPGSICADPKKYKKMVIAYWVGLVIAVLGITSPNWIVWFF